jgi:hypothetical protein
MTERVKIVVDLRRLGFGALFFQALANLECCLDNGLEPYITISSDGYAENTSINCWDRVFYQPFHIKESDAIGYPSYHNWQLFQGENEFWKKDDGYWVFGYEGYRWEDPKFLQPHRDVVAKYITPLPSITEKVDKFLQPYSGKKILGVHKRGRSHYISGHGAGFADWVDMNKIFSYIDEQIEDYDYLYYMSDEGGTYSKIIDRYKEKAIYLDTKAQYVNNNEDLNHQELSGSDRILLLDNLIAEVLILSRCDYLLLTGSNVSHMAQLFGNNNNFKFYDAGVTYV